MGIKIESVNISEAKGTEKHSIPGAELTKIGLVGDAHAGTWHRQLSLLGHEEIQAFSKKANMDIQPGAFGENITLSGIDLSKVAVLDRLKIGEAEVEITQIGKTCHGDSCSIFKQVGECIMPSQGLFARTITPGMVNPGDGGEYFPRPLRVHVITLSDRASAGEYKDLSGPKIQQLISEHYKDTRWHLAYGYTLLPDDPIALENELTKLVQDGVDIIFATGGTGVGPRDFTPEVVSKVIEKEVPGIMENVRVKFGATIPNARLSRSVAGVAKKTQIYALPGSVKAVQEYVSEIVTTMDHLIKMLHGIGH
jgi:molybdopterin adenylyltransferase